MLRPVRLAALVVAPLATLTVLSLAAARPPRPPRASSDAVVVATLDERYQAAVKANDVAGMDSILAPDFVLVTGRGAVFTKQDLLASARRKEVIYEHQEDEQRTVRLYGGTAVVTALLWEKGVQQGTPFDKRLWFSDVYIKGPAGWRYVFGQASTALPAR